MNAYYNLLHLITKHQKKCPYCNAAISGNSIKSSFCPVCSNFYYVLKTWNKITYLQEQEVLNNLPQHRSSALDKKFQLLFETIGLSKEEYKRRRKLWEKEYQGQNNIEDFIWHLFDILEIELTNKGQKQLLEKYYYAKALFLETQEKDCHELLKQMSYMKLLLEKESGLSIKVKILTAGDSTCAYCKSLEGKVFSIEEALEKMPLPNPKCKNGYRMCRCKYIIEYKEK
jgi:hypothetical protein